MKLFLSKLIVFFLIFFIVDKAFILVRYNSSKNEYDKRLESILKGNMNKDLLILGSSRGARSIIASQIQDSLNINCFNLSYLKSNIVFHEFLLKKIINHNKPPKTIILVIDELAEFNNTVLDFRIDKLIPLVNYSEIREELIFQGEKKYFISNLFVLNQLYRQNFDFRKKTISKFDSIQICGSMPLITNEMKKGFFKYEKGNNKYSSNQESESNIKSFKNFEKLCLDNNIKLIYVFPPNFRKINTVFEKRFKELTDYRTNIFYYNLNEKEYRNSANFIDEGHLNKNGAIIFTNELIEYLK
jgi:hypothetical protein